MEDQVIIYRSGPNLSVHRRTGEHQQYWERRWGATNLKAMLKNARRGALGELDYPFQKYLPKDGPLLEAGCGPGRIVCALQELGYTVEGIDYAAETIARVRTFDPSLDLRVGDVFAVDRPDGYYAAYISLGVLEHHESGLETGLAEARRVLRPGGVGLVMVPYLNRPRRRLHAHAPSLDPGSTLPGFRFYQHQYDPAYIARRLEDAGFEIQETLPLQLFEGLSSDFKLGRWLNQRHFFSWRLSRSLKRMCERAPGRLKWAYSHMLLYCAHKK
jgi:SAM-dependent methyltransferase